MENIGKPLPIEQWKDAVRIVCDALNNIKSDPAALKYDFALIGSGAYVAHGVEFSNPDMNPADIDITTTNPRLTKAAIQALSDKGIEVIERPDSSMVVGRFTLKFKSGNEVDLDFTYNNDFGFSTAKIEDKNRLRVTSLFDTLQSAHSSLQRRPDHREKDITAFRQLIERHVDELAKMVVSENFAKIENEGFKSSLNLMLNVLRDPEKMHNEAQINALLDKLYPQIAMEQSEKNPAKPSRALSDHSVFNKRDAHSRPSHSKSDPKDDARRQRALEKRQEKK